MFFKRTLLCWAFLSCFIGSRLSSIAHFILIEHSYCTEHGEAIHKDSHTKEKSKHHTHEHCEILFVERLPVTFASFFQTLEPVFSVLNYSFLKQHPFYSIALEYLAPKTSPPSCF